MQPTVIDIAGTAREFVKWVLKEVLLLLGVVVFGLSAPLLFTVGMEWLVWKNYDLSTWSVVYFFAGPFACALWMVFICYLTDPKYWRALRRVKSGEIDRWEEDYGGVAVALAVKPVWFLVSGFFGSILAEALLVTKVIQMFPDNVSVRTNTVVFYAIAPFFVFAPVLLVLLSRARSWKNDRLARRLKAYATERAQQYRDAARQVEELQAMEMSEGQVKKAGLAWRAELEEALSHNPEALLSDLPAESLKVLQEFLQLQAEGIGRMARDTLQDRSLEKVMLNVERLASTCTPESLAKAQELLSASVNEAYLCPKDLRSKTIQ